MTDATLGINIVSASAQEAATNLDAMVPAAERAERAVDRMVNSVSSDLQAVATAASSNVVYIDQMAGALDRSAAVARTASTSVRDSIDAMFASSGGRDRAADIAAYGAEMDKLRAKFSPLFAAQQQYEGQLNEIAQAERLGAISAMEAADARQRAASSAMAIVGPMRGVAGATDAYGKAAGSAAGQTGNLVSQFNDVGVMLAAGQNPLTLALQQGTQISQVLNDIGGKTSVVGALGGAFLQMLNPISLVTIGTIAAGAAMVRFFTSSEEESDKAAEALKQQASLIRDVADEWGDAVPAIRAYADELERAGRLTDLAEAGEIINAKLYEDARETIASLSNDLVMLRGDLELIGGPEAAGKIAAVENAFRDLEEKIADGTATAEDARAVQQALAAVMDMGGQAALNMSGSLGTLAGSLESVSASAVKAQSDIAGAISQLQTFHAAEAQSRTNAEVALRSGAEFVKEQERVNSLSREELNLENEINRVRASANKDGAILGQEKVLDLAKQNIAAEKRRADIAKAAAKAAADAARAAKGGGKGKKTDAEKEADKAKRAMEREEEQRKKIVEGLKFEASLIGKTTLEKRILTEQRRAHADATSAEGQAISGYITQLQAADLAAERLADVQDYMAQTGADLFTSAISGADSFKDALAGVAAELGQMLANQAFLQLVGGGQSGAPGIAGGIFSSILGGLGRSAMPATGSFAGGFAPAVYGNGTNFHPGGPAIVNDRGGEIINLPRGSQVIPHDISREMARGGRQEVDVRVSVDNEGGIRTYVKRETSKSEGRAVNRSVGAVRRGDASSRHFWKR